MKTILLLAAQLLLCNNIINAQALGWLWAQDPGGGNAYGIAADASGNIYITGEFNGASIQFGNTTLNNGNGASNSDFLTKYDPSGNAIWAVGANENAAGTYFELAVCTDVHSNVLVAGNYTGANMVIGTDTLRWDGNGSDCFVAKYDSSGNLIWAKNAGSNGTPLSISTDVSGAVYLTGYFESPKFIVGNDTLTYIASGNNSTDIIIIKFDASGTVVWAKNAGGNGIGYGISTDTYGHVYVTGTFYGPANIIFGIDTLHHTGGNSGNAFIVKYDLSGNVIWAKSPFNTGRTSGSGVITDINGNVYITGGCGSNVVLGNDTLTGNSNSNAFIIKYDSSGNVIWAKTGGKDAFSTAISLDSKGNSYITGQFSSPAVIFGTDTLIYANSDSTGGAEIFVVKYDTSGGVVWAKKTDGGAPILGYNEANSVICTDANGNSYLTGWYATPTLNFDDITLNYTQGNTLFGDIFIAKLGNAATDIDAVKNSIDIVNVFPNPSTSTFNFTGVPTGSIIQVYNVLGELVSSSIADNSIYQLHLNDAKGIYFYRVVQSDNVIGQGKIIEE
jgi:hypothetical protein